MNLAGVEGPGCDVSVCISHRLQPDNANHAIYTQFWALGDIHGKRLQHDIWISMTIGVASARQGEKNE